MNRHIKGTALSVWIIILGLLGCCLAYSYGATTIYIPDQFPTIQQGIDAAAAGDTVVVRNGTYKLTAPLDFKGKAITVISQNGAANCFLDGQNSTRVIYFHSGEGRSSVLSGFAIQNGRAAAGAGIYCSSSSPSISFCTISANTAREDDGHGGGIACDASSPAISNCTIAGNFAEADWIGAGYGGGIYINGGSPIIMNTTISGNGVSGNGRSWGGGLYVNGSSPSIVNSAISNNSASGTGDYRGGGIYFSTSTPSLVNCIINGNSANTGAGIRFDSSSAFSSLTNCTIVRNTAATNGGALYLASSSPQIINSILWQDSPQEVFKESVASNPTITYSDVTGSYAGTGNINSSPLFVNIAQLDYHLTLTSPCIDTGSNAAPELPLQDMDGNARINNFVVDMGAYEYSSTILLLNNNRFRVQVDWHITSGATGHGVAVPLTSDSGYFWFFSGNNVELLIKILDGRGVNNHYWFFWGAMTDVQYTITVTDTQTGAVKTYQGIQGVQKSGNDINAF